MPFSIPELPAHVNRVVGYSATVGRVILAGGADADAGVFSATESRAHVRGRAGVGVASGLVPDSPWLESVASAPADALEDAPAVPVPGLGERRLGLRRWNTTEGSMWTDYAGEEKGEQSSIFVPRKC